MTSPPLSRALRAALAVTIVGTACADVSSKTGADTEVIADTTTADGNTTATDTTDPSTTDTTVANDVSADDTTSVPDTTATEPDTDSTPEDAVADTEPDPADADDTTVEPGEDATPDVAQVDADDTEASADTSIVEDVTDEDTTLVVDGSGSPPEGFCKDMTDEICPDRCTVDNDFDCCMAQNEGGFMFCTYFAGGGCGCAVEGPFAPPSTGVRRLGLRHSVA